MNDIFGDNGFDNMLRTFPCRNNNNVSDNISECQINNIGNSNLCNKWLYLVKYWEINSPFCSEGKNNIFFKKKSTKNKRTLIFKYLY